MTKKITPEQQKIFDKIVTIADDFGAVRSDVTMEAKLSYDLGLDSVDQIQLLMDIEREFNLSIPKDVHKSVQTVGDVVRAVEKIQHTNTRKQNSTCKEFSINGSKLITVRKCNVDLSECPMVNFARTSGNNYKTNTENAIQHVRFCLADKPQDKIDEFATWVKYLHKKCKHR